MRVLLQLTIAASLLLGLTSQSEDDVHFQNDEDDANILLWNELKQQVQRLEKNRAADLKRITKLEEDKKRLRADLDQLRRASKRKPVVKSTAPRERKRRSAKTESGEFLPVQFQTVSQDGGGVIEDLQHSQVLEGEDYEDVAVPEQLVTDPQIHEEQHHREPTVESHEHDDDQDKKLHALSKELRAVSELVSTLAACCNRSRDLDNGVDTLMAADFSSPSTDNADQEQLDQLKDRVHHTGVSLAGIQQNQYELRDHQKWIIFQLEQINNDLASIDEDRRKIWNSLKHRRPMTDQIGNGIAVESESVSSEEEHGENHINGGGAEEASGDLDSSGWHAVSFVDDGASVIAAATFVRTPSGANDSPRLVEVEKTARDAYSIVTQLKTKLDVIEKDLSKTTGLFKDLEKSQLTQSELNAFTHTIDFMQEALLNVTSSLLENEAIHERQHSQVQTDLVDVLKRLRLLSLQTEKAKHLAQVVKDHQMDHFSAIQQFRQDLSTLETNVLRLGMKLTNFQADVLNATLSSYKENNKDLQQDVQIADLYTRIDRVDGKFPEIHQTMKDMATSIRTKSDRTEVKKLGADVQSVTEKLQMTTAINSSISTVADAVRVLESQLPTDCSMSTVPYRMWNLTDGPYVIKPKDSPKAIVAYCQHRDSSSVGWTVIQKRSSGHEDFNRTWDEYRHGFGDPKREYWIGNEYIHMLTRQADCVLRVDAWDIYGEYRYAEYSSFKVASFVEGYRLDIGQYSGNLTDALGQQNGMRFSTYDLDADTSSTHCARYYSSGWWFSNCLKTNLNGAYPLGVIWFSTSSNDWLQLERTMMKVRAIK